MTDAQIKQILERTERRLALGNLRLPTLGWGVSLFAVGALCGVGLPGMALFFGALLAFPAVQVSREAAAKWREFKRAPATRLWRELADRDLLLSSPSVETFQLKTLLRTLYASDGRGEVLPLTQAARLLLIYNLQQKRLELMRLRRDELRGVRDQLGDRVARLQKLGEGAPSVELSLAALDEELVHLARLGNETGASCARLEAIVLLAQRAVQIKQLHREIAGLSASLAPGSRALEAPEVVDIERQIGREIETFLALERQSEEVLRGV